MCKNGFYKKQKTKIENTFYFVHPYQRPVNDNRHCKIIIIIHFRYD